MATILSHTLETIKQLRIKSESVKKDVFLVHEFIDRIKYIGPELCLRAMSHNTWFVEYMLPLYIKHCPVFSKIDIPLYKEIGMLHLKQDFKNNTLSIEDIYVTNDPWLQFANEKTERRLKNINTPVEYKQLTEAIIESKIPYILLGFNGFLSSYILHSIAANIKDGDSKKVYPWIKLLKETVGNKNLSIDELYKFMHQKIPYLNNGFTYVRKPNNENNGDLKQD